MKITKERLRLILKEEINNVKEMQGTHTYAYLNSMPAKRDSDRELDEWLNEALGEGFGFLEKDWSKEAEEAGEEVKLEPVVGGDDESAKAELSKIEKELKGAAAEAGGKSPKKSKKGGALKTAAKAGLGTAGVYQTVQALQALGDLSSDVLASVVSKMDPAMVDIIKQIGDVAGQLFEEQDVQEQ